MSGPINAEDVTLDELLQLIQDGHFLYVLSNTLQEKQERERQIHILIEFAEKKFGVSPKELKMAL